MTHLASAHTWKALAAAAVIAIAGSGCSAGPKETPPPPAPKPAAPAVPKNPIVALTTNKGVIKIEVNKTRAPITAGNFLDLVNRGFYKNMVFHRVEPGFVVQTGDPQGTGEGGFIDPKTGRERTIKLETSPDLKHDAPGVVAMARLPDPQRDSASSQFYITLAPTPFLDNNYAVFGRVVEGMDVVNKIQVGDKFVSAKVVSPAPAKAEVKGAATRKPAVKKAPAKKPAPKKPATR